MSRALDRALLQHEEMPNVGGDPIVESGSNSDGEWIRWADGTLACAVNINATYTIASILSASWTFPVPNASANDSRISVVSMGSLPTGAKQLWAPQVFSISTTATTIEIRNDVNRPYVSGDVIKLRAQFNGRWF